MHLDARDALGLAAPRSTQDTFPCQGLYRFLRMPCMRYGGTGMLRKMFVGVIFFQVLCFLQSMQGFKQHGFGSLPAPMSQVAFYQ